MRHLLIVLLAATLAGCINVRIDEAGIERLERWAEEQEVASEATQRHFLIAQGTFMAGDGADVEQVLLECTVIAVPGDAPMPVLEAATPYEHPGSMRIWKAGSDATKAMVAERANVLAMPSVVSRVGETASVEIGEADAEGNLGEGHHLTLDPSREGDQLVLRIGYQQRRDGGLVRAIVPVTVKGKPGRTWILEIQAATTEAADR